MRSLLVAPDALERRRGDVAASSDLTALDARLRAGVGDFIARPLFVPEAKALLLDAPNLPTKEFKVIAAKQKRYARVLVDALSEYLGRKAPRVNLKAIAFILFGMCNSIMHWHDPEGPIKLEELTDMCLNIFLRGTTHYIGATDGRRTEGA